MGGKRTFIATSLVLLPALIGSTARAVDPANVLVLYNAASPSGQDIANYYAQVHPGVQLLGLTGVSTAEDITADAYLSTIRPQVMAALGPNTDLIVTTKGLPLRIQVTEPVPPSIWPNPPSYTDPNGVFRQISSWKPYSSLESELADIDKVSSWQMMGDQSFTQSGHFTINPYYGSTSSFSHAVTGTRLSARLDGYTTADVKAGIDRAQHAFIGPNNTPNGPVGFLVDNDPSKAYAPTMANLVNNVLTPLGLPVTYDNTSAFVGTAPGPVIGYDGHGTNQSSTPAHYITAGLNTTLANGAVFNSWESYNAYSFNVGGYTGTQGQLADWLKVGGTAAVGNVTEPGASVTTVANEDKLFSMLINGKTFAEAAWSANRQLSYVNTVVGDPLMTWHQLLAGDANMDGLVDNSDLNIIGSHWGNSLTPGGYGWSQGDLNGDGVVDLLDLSLMSSTWGQVSSWHDSLMSATSQPLSSGSGITAFLEPTLLTGEGSDGFIPEPSSFVLAAIAGLGLAGFCRRRAKRAS